MIPTIMLRVTMVSCSILKLVLSPASLVLLFLVVGTTAFSNDEIASSYVSVRTLDHYGNAIQLGHAKEATQRYGRSVVVAVVDGCEKTNSTVRSEEEEQQYETEEGKMPSSPFLMVVSVGKSPILHTIQLPLRPEDSSSSPFLAMCFTGVKGDANWMLRQIQNYAADVWERYCTSSMSAPVVAHVVARLLGRFAAQPEKQEWQSSLGLPGKHDRDDDMQSSWSRPLGVQTMILSLGSFSPPSLSNARQKHPQDPPLLIVEPSGRILNPSANNKFGQVTLGAMGKGSDKVQARLNRLLRESDQSEMSLGDSSSQSEHRDDRTSSLSWKNHPPTFDSCRDALIRILLEETTNTKIDGSSNQQDGGGHIMVESYSPDLGQIERRLFRYQNMNNFAPI